MTDYCGISLKYRMLIELIPDTECCDTILGLALLRFIVKNFAGPHQASRNLRLLAKWNVSLVTWG